MMTREEAVKLLRACAVLYYGADAEMIRLAENEFSGCAGTQRTTDPVHGYRNRHGEQIEGDEPTETPSPTRAFFERAAGQPIWLRFLHPFLQNGRSPIRVAFEHRSRTAR